MYRKSVLTILTYIILFFKKNCKNHGILFVNSDFIFVCNSVKNNRILETFSEYVYPAYSKNCAIFKKQLTRFSCCYLYICIIDFISKIDFKCLFGCFTEHI